jgi:hypothetical protein
MCQSLLPVGDVVPELSTEIPAGLTASASSASDPCCVNGGPYWCASSDTVYPSMIGSVAATTPRSVAGYLDALSSASALASTVFYLLLSLVIALLLASSVVPRLRALLVDQLLGNLVEAIMRPTRTAELKAQQNAQRLKEISDAVGTLQFHLTRYAQSGASSNL